MKPNRWQRCRPTCGVWRAGEDTAGGGGTGTWGGGGDCWLDRLDFPIPNVCKGQQQQQQLLFKRTMTFHCVWLVGFTLFSRTRTAGIRSRRSDWSCSLCVRKRCRRPFTCEEFRSSSSRRWSSRCDNVTENNRVKELWMEEKLFSLCQHQNRTRPGPPSYDQCG